jgi:cytochrome c
VIREFLAINAKIDEATRPPELAAVLANSSASGTMRPPAARVSSVGTSILLICVNPRRMTRTDYSNPALEPDAAGALAAKIGADDMSRERMLLATVIASAVAAGCATAQEVGEPNRGLELAQRLCAQCHAVRKDQLQSPNAQAPRFQVVASVPGMTAIALSAALNTSHRVMPNILLAPDEQAHIIAYILSLK